MIAENYNSLTLECHTKTIPTGPEGRANSRQALADASSTDAYKPRSSSLPRGVKTSADLSTMAPAGLTNDAYKPRISSSHRGVKISDNNSSTAYVAKCNSMQSELDCRYGGSTSAEHENKLYGRENWKQTGGGENWKQTGGGYSPKLWQCGYCHYQNKTNISLCPHCFYPRSNGTSDVKNVSHPASSVQSGYPPGEIQ